LALSVNLQGPLSARTNHEYAANGILVVQVCHLGPISREIPRRAPRKAPTRLKRNARQ
jgi:hypothetical protein